MLGTLTIGRQSTAIPSLRNPNEPPYWNLGVPLPPYVLIVRVPNIHVYWGGGGDSTEYSIEERVLMAWLAPEGDRSPVSSGQGRSRDPVSKTVCRYVRNPK